MIRFRSKYRVRIEQKIEQLETYLKLVEKLKTYKKDENVINATSMTERHRVQNCIDLLKSLL